MKTTGLDAPSHLLAVHQKSIQISQKQVKEKVVRGSLLPVSRRQAEAKGILNCLKFSLGQGGVVVSTIADACGCEGREETSLAQGLGEVPQGSSGDVCLL